MVRFFSVLGRVSLVPRLPVRVEKLQKFPGQFHTSERPLPELGAAGGFARLVERFLSIFVGFKIID